MRYIETDLAVMGSGLAGLAAAITAAEQGVRVAVFEKRPFQGGGVSNTPMATTAVRDDPAYQDRAFHSIFDYTKYNGDPGVIRTWVNYSSRIPAFLKKLNTEFLNVVEVPLEMIGKERTFAGGFPPAYNIGDYYRFKPRGRGHGAALICLNGVKKLKELGGELYLSTPITGILMEQGRVVGVCAHDRQTGEAVQVSCRALVVASGGFSDNREMIKQYTGFTYTDNNCSGDGNVLFNPFPNAQQTGDGQLAVWAVGGARGAMGINGHDLVPGPGIIGNTPWIVQNQTRTIQEQPYLWVNQAGARFIDESKSKNHMAMGTAISRQPGRCSYIIFDDDTRRHMEEEGVDYQYFIFPADRLEDVRGQFVELIEEKQNKHIFLADDLEDLCAQTGIHLPGLRATLDAYNRFCREGHDDEFSKNPAFLRPVCKAPFYAMRVFNGGYTAFGGIKINGKCQVLDERGTPIPGLYAAGDCACGEVWGDPPVGGIGQSNIAFALGFASGEQAATYLAQEGGRGE